VWRVSVDDGDRSLIPTPDAQAVHPDVDPITGALVYVSRRVNDSIWHIRPRSDNEAQARAIAESSRRDGAPSWSPDGRHVAFVSDRSGTWQIWMADLETRRARRVTRLDLGQPGRPHFSPDGKRLAFSVLESGIERLMVLDLASGRSHRVPAVGRHDLALGWSSDDRIVARSDGRAAWSLVAVDPESGKAEIIEEEWPEGHPVRVANGRVFFSSDRSEGLWVYDFEDRTRRQLVPAELTGDWRSWAPCRDHVIFTTGSGGLKVDRLGLGTTHVERDVFDVPDSIVSVTPSPDCTALLAVRRMRGESDLVALNGLGF
jgi:Tol biopolymer transport system component